MCFCVKGPLQLLRISYRRLRSQTILIEYDYSSICHIYFFFLAYYPGRARNTAEFFTRKKKKYASTMITIVILLVTYSVQKERVLLKCRTMWWHTELIIHSITKGRQRRMHPHHKLCECRQRRHW